MLSLPWPDSIPAQGTTTPTPPHPKKGLGEQDSYAQAKSLLGRKVLKGKACDNVIDHLYARCTAPSSELLYTMYSSLWLASLSQALERKVVSRGGGRAVMRLKQIGIASGRIFVWEGRIDSS